MGENERVKPKVSVIVPIYNVEKFLTRCVESIQKQTLKDIEIILVDDGSPDKCPKMCEEFLKQDNRVKVIHKKNGGLGYARNSGIEIATGEYIAFVDADDYIDLDMYEVMYNAASINDVDFVRVDNYKESIGGKILNRNEVPPMKEGIYDKNRLREELLFPQLGLLPTDTGNRYVSCSVWRNIYRKSIIEKYSIRFVSERDLISEDIPFNISYMMKCESAYVINRKYYHYIVNQKSLTQSYNPDRFNQEIILYHALENQLKAQGIYDKCKMRLERHLLARVRMCLKSELSQPTSYRAKKTKCLNILRNHDVRRIMNRYPVMKLPLKYRTVVMLEKYYAIFALNLFKNIL